MKIKVREIAFKVLLLFAAFLLLIFIPTMVIPEVRAAEAGVKWDRWNIAPFASSKEEACAKVLIESIDGFNMPPPVKEHFKAALGATCKGGTEVWLTPHQRLEQMWSGGPKPHVMNNVTVGELPVLKSPDGRSYRKGAVAEAAKAFSWTFAHEGKVYVLYLPFVCFNVSWVATASPEQPVVPAVLKPLGACPDVYTLKVNVWERKAFNLPGVERTAAKEELEEKFVGASHVSRMHGGQFRKAYAAGEIARSATTRVFRVSFIMTPEVRGEAPAVTEEHVLGDVPITGLHELQFSRAQLETWDAIRVVSINDDVVSPPRYHQTGLHELRFFNRLPGTTLGEWDSNPVPDCIMNEHWIE
ncbi:hypothetical protein HY972_02770 [Candidatus Kaiserbacteria bacterium]|nr:hypothetical protein [Candidatus Kaiserbacteria bacterium]